MWIENNNGCIQLMQKREVEHPNRLFPNVCLGFAFCNSREGFRAETGRVILDKTGRLKSYKSGEYQEVGFISDY